MAVATTTYFSTDATGPQRKRILKPGWPLTWLFVPFPLWWVLGVSHFIFIGAAVVMAWELFRRRPVYVPLAWGFWLLWLVVVIAGATLLWVQPDGTQPVKGIGKAVNFSYHMMWNLSMTIVAVYIVNLPKRALSDLKIARLLGLMFIYTAIGGILGLVVTGVDFPSLLEVVLPIPNAGFIKTLFHPALALPSDFLGYDQVRPMAPFAYPNSWGNNIGLFMPFFVWAFIVANKGWRRYASIAMLVLAIFPIVYSLNRGLWAGLLFGLVLLGVKLAVMGHMKVLWYMAAGALIGGLVFVSSPLYDTVTLRTETPHSDGRRETVASEVVDKTLSLSPLVGYGESRKVTGSFSSIAGGETPDCHQCAAPTLGTQGFMWRLILTNGFLGTALFLAFLFAQLWYFAPARDPVAIVGCLVICLSIVYSFVYDSLEAPLFTMMMAIGLMNRRYVSDDQLAGTPPKATVRT